MFIVTKQKDRSTGKDLTGRTSRSYLGYRVSDEV